MNKKPTYAEKFAEFRTAVNHAYEMLVQHGEDSKEHKKAEVAMDRLASEANRLRHGLSLND